MRSSLSWVWGISVLVLIAAGCGGDSHDDGGSGGGGGGGGGGGADLTYPSGHSLRIDNTSAAFLAVEDELLTLCNNHRVSNALNALIDDPVERGCARAHSKHMIEHDFFNPVNPEGDGPGARLTACGVTWTAAGENIAAGYTTAQDAFNGWLGSPPHKANLEDPIWTHTGTGYWYDAADAGSEQWFHYYTQVFTKQ